MVVLKAMPMGLRPNASRKLRDALARVVRKHGP
jgi:hypothetical protein